MGDVLPLFALDEPVAQTRRPAADFANAPPTGARPTRLAVWVHYTGVIAPKRYSSHTLYDPPMDRMLLTALEDLERSPASVEVVAALKDREPPIYHSSVVILTRDVGEDGKPRRWPVAYLTPLVGAFDLAEVRQAFLRIGGRA